MQDIRKIKSAHFDVNTEIIYNAVIFLMSFIGGLMLFFILN